MSACEVRLWGSLVGAVSWDAKRRLGLFRYHPDFVPSGIEVAPIKMPLGPGTRRFPELVRSSFHGLPGLVADALPDRFGNAVIDAWLASEGRAGDELNPVERLAYTGTRGMGALEFHPSLSFGETKAVVNEPLQIGALVDLANGMLARRKGLSVNFKKEHAGGLARLLAVGTSAGGARAKAVVAWNPATGEIRSGQTELAPGFEHWLLKFDGVKGNGDKEAADPLGFGLIEFAYFQMARAGGIQMSDCRILDLDGHQHFMTRRFDRVSSHSAWTGSAPNQAPPATSTPTEKLHMASLAGLAHLDYDLADAHSYEQAFGVGRVLQLPASDHEQLFRRLAFNALARNQDDHVKNIAYLMDKSGRWRLAPAFDLTFAYNPKGDWTSQHQMSINGKRGGFETADFQAIARFAGLKPKPAQAAFDEVRSAVSHWLDFADAAGVAEIWAHKIGELHS